MSNKRKKKTKQSVKHKKKMNVKPKVTEVEVREMFAEKVTELPEKDIPCLYAATEMNLYLIRNYPRFLKEVLKRDFMNEIEDGVKMGEGICSLIAHVLYIVSDCYLFEKVLGSDEEHYHSLAEFRQAFRINFMVNYSKVSFEPDFLGHLDYKFESKLIGNFAVEQSDDPEEALSGVLMFNLFAHTGMNPELWEWLSKKDYVQNFYVKLLEIRQYVHRLSKLSKEEMENVRTELVEKQVQLWMVK